ncbi:DNA-binding transcriptional regulator, AcrR family [Ferrimonas sediminum]|uniref:DNA-binding transcriptional regulator, AcrR family n=1 Tax=Ferrimonas sediminum TaxID=718193 RepID=A0A1G8TY87_9GAMM|nr:TetR/AcrR family transcriptional regulator [Ferrimonas sediminum]SDJ46354.1 DNA-binding transcriptional regulator, AcrR family [Ferrimonas sediminum]
MRASIIREAKLEISKCGPGSISVLALSKKLGISKNFLYSEFKNREGIVGSVLIELFSGLYNTGVSVNNCEHFNAKEKIVAYYSLCVIKPLINRGDIGVHFLLHNMPFWVGLDEDKKEEMKVAFKLHFDFIERVMVRHGIEHSPDFLELAKVKLNALERGLLLTMANILNPCRKHQAKDIINIISHEVKGLFVTHSEQIDQDKVSVWVEAFINSLPEWAD